MESGIKMGLLSGPGRDSAAVKVVPLALQCSFDRPRHPPVQNSNSSLEGGGEGITKERVAEGIEGDL